MGEGDTTTAEVEGRGRIHGHFDGGPLAACPDCAETAKTMGVQAAEAVKPKRPRGFAAMDRALVSEIASKGGKAAHVAGTAHEFTSEKAREAGRKGGRASQAKRSELQDCACGQHGYNWARRQWWLRTSTGRLAPVDGGLPCMKGRGPEAVEGK